MTEDHRTRTSFSSDEIRGTMVTPPQLTSLGYWRTIYTDQLLTVQV